MKIRILVSLALMNFSGVVCAFDSHLKYWLFDVHDEKSIQNLYKQSYSPTSFLALVRDDKLFIKTGDGVIKACVSQIDDSSLKIVCARSIASKGDTIVLKIYEEWPQTFFDVLDILEDASDAQEEALLKRAEALVKNHSGRDLNPLAREFVIGVGPQTKLLDYFRSQKNHAAVSFLKRFVKN